MTENKVVMLKLYNGDFIIGTIDNELDGIIYLNDPRNFMMMPTMTGDIHIALRPISAPFKAPRLNKSCEIRRDQIMFMLNEDEIDTDVINGYKSEISGIKIATAAEAASIASSANSSSQKEFII